MINWFIMVKLFVKSDIKEILKLWYVIIIGIFPSDYVTLFI